MKGLGLNRDAYKNGFNLYKSVRAYACVACVALNFNFLSLKGFNII